MCKYLITWDIQQNSRHYQGNYFYKTNNNNLTEDDIHKIREEICKSMLCIFPENEILSRSSVIIKYIYKLGD